ncbi:hypothetical protein GH714_029377 [Hevea brasiliensis]|uniref:BZIP domain-containing protein n=1 Tax=Hevea brasiliensis TaxID=3981 RepID=A0A6A6KB59_HEVBR|nr:hypothetical protein GH714_029377 [Hevea brasiliensis]
MEMEKGQKSSHREDDFLRLVMDYQPLLPPLPPKSAASGKPRNLTQENMLTSGEIIMNKSASPSDQFQAGSVSSSSGSSSPKENLVLAEMEHAGGEEFFSKFLTMGKATASVSPGIHVSSNPPLPPTPNVAHPDDDMGFKKIPPELLAVHPPASPAPTSRARPTGLRKAMAPEMLANLVLHDPKKAKRIITNRMSAVRAKEKKRLYTFMLEHQLQTLQSESAALTAHFALLQQTESISLNAENLRLKEQTGLILQQMRLQDTLNEEVRNEIQHLRLLAQMGQNQNQGMMLNNNSTIGNYGQNLNFQVQVPNPYQQLQELNNAGQQFPWQLQHSDHEHFLHQQELQDQNPPFMEANPNIPNPIPHHQDDQESSSSSNNNNKNE